MQRGAWTVMGVFVTLAVAWVAFPSLAPAQDGAAPADAASEPSQDYIERFRHAQRLMGRGKPDSDDEAERTFRRLLFERPRQAEVHHALGLLLMHRGRRKECLGFLLDAAKYAPTEPVIQRDAGAQLLHQGRAAESVAYFSRARKEGPEDLETWVGWGRALLLTGETAKAREVFEAALRLDEGSIDARVGLGWSLVGTDPERARELVGPPVPPHFADVAIVDGLALEQQGAFDEAVERLATSVQYAPPDGVGAAILGAAADAFARHRHAAGAAKAAAKWLDATLRWDMPDRFRAAFLLGTAQVGAGETAKGLVVLRSVAADAHAPVELRARAHLVCADRLAAAGKPDAARAHLGSAAKLEEAPFEAAAATAILAGGGEVAAAEGRANDEAWLRALAARLEGDSAAAAQHDQKALELSEPPGEFPGLLLAPPKTSDE